MMNARLCCALLALLLSMPAAALFDRGGSPLSSGGDDIPPPDRAMQVEAEADTDEQAVSVQFRMLDNVYLYHHNLEFRLVDQDGNELADFADFEPPEGEVLEDEFFGRVEVSFDALDLLLPLDSVPLTEAVLEVEYQGCLKEVLCYPPQRAELPVSFVEAAELAMGAEAPGAEEPGENFFTTLLSEDAGAFSRWMEDQSLAMVATLFFLGGVLLAFTPCVFPMVPILSGIIAGQRHPTALRGFSLSSAYVLGMAVPYTLIGLVVALFGASVNVQYWLQQPAAIITSSVIFVLLALAMFGLFNLQLPAFLRQRLAAGEARTGGSLGGSALLGGLSALVVSPCVTPILAGALLYVAGSGDAATGAFTLFSLALGMGAPLIAYGAGGSHLLPRAGPWMEQIKRFFGVVMLGVAIWLLDRLLHDSLTLGLYGVLLALYGVQLGALEPASAGISRLRRGVALVLALYGAVMVVGAAAGGTSVVQPLGGNGHEARETAADDNGIVRDDEDAFVTTRGREALEELMREARDEGRPVLLDFSAEWCLSCKALEANTLSHPDVLEAMEARDMKLIRADMTRVNRENQGIMREHEVLGLPSLLFFTPEGEEIPDSRVLGEVGPEGFLEHLDGRVFNAL